MADFDVNEELEERELSEGSDVEVEGEVFVYLADSK